ncbi:MAG UNVERIFIED_CONTAM: acyl-CoA dehydrogenase family protein [Anaerolineae bacterium]
MYIQDSVFGRIVNFDELRRRMRSVYDAITPNFNLLRTVETLSEHFDDDPNLMIAGGASMLAYMMIPAAGEYELAEELKGNLFTLGWTEEQTGSDLLSIRTTATKVNDDPDDKTYHLSGGKWMINNSYHADYHCVLAKIAPSKTDLARCRCSWSPAAARATGNALRRTSLRGWYSPSLRWKAKGGYWAKLVTGCKSCNAWHSPASINVPGWACACCAVPFQRRSTGWRRRIFSA